MAKGSSNLPGLFRYCGSKRYIVPLLKAPLLHKRVVEPYLGSGSYIMSREGPALGIDINQNIIDLWLWLKNEATHERLVELDKICQDAVAAHPDWKPDVRSLGLSKGEQVYVRVNNTGLVVGQLSSWKIYPKYRLPVENTSGFLDRLKDVEIRLGSASSYVEEDGDLVFIDPPYRGTQANYKQDAKNGIEESYRPEDTIALISRIKAPIIFTYGTDAPKQFPQYEWTQLLIKKVPNMRRGGTVDRIEHVAYINWK